MFKKIRKVFDRVDAFEKRHRKLFMVLDAIWICIVPLIFHVMLQYGFIETYGVAPTQEEYNLITGASFALAYLFAIITISEQSARIRHLESVGQNQSQDKSGNCNLSDNMIL